MNIAILVFPGTHGEGDIYHAWMGLDSESASGQKAGVSAEYVWHEETDLSAYDAIFLPGGTSYGDYLRPGALASHSPVLAAVHQAAAEGKPVVGVGNGFQILLEAGLLPGTVLSNESLKFQCLSTELEVVNHKTMFTHEYSVGETLTIPIAHRYGNYYCDEETLASLEANEQIVFRYRENINGSVSRIAGVINREGNVLGMMPHPERAVEEILGSTDGRRLFTSILSSWREKHAHV